jgi:hypothetical protein
MNASNNGEIQMAGFDTAIVEQDGVLSGPVRAPRQMLAAQEYDGHTSIHDEATAQKLGFKSATIEGPTHFSQFAPLGFALWGERWMAQGCISAHYRSPVFEGEEVKAFLRRPADQDVQAEIWMLRANGDEILRGTASVGPNFPSSALDQRLISLPALADPVILADVKIGMRSPRTPVGMEMNQHMGALYPFSLAQKLSRITEPSVFYSGANQVWRRALVPLEMISVLMQYSARDNAFKTRGPAVGLFADQEIRLLDGPVFVGEPYEIEREIVSLSGSRRTESMWVRSTLYAPDSERKVAQMLLNLATMKETYARYAEEHAALYGAAQAR